MKYCFSPNFDDRPGGVSVDTIVIHATVLNSLDEVVQRFADPQTRVSAHYTVDRDGTVAVHVPEDKRAWHAGQSRMPDGRECVNDFSVGVELVNLNDGVDSFPHAQIGALRDLIRSIAARHPIKHIVPHYACADPPGRKSDPVGFDGEWIRGLY
jgi:N-acetyl-anhydromuramyl-L-alanine amidase AmpD